MASGPALVYGKLVFPLARNRNVLGRFDPSTGTHADIDLAPLGLGLAVSRRHAEVIWAEGGFVLRDLGSRLGTTVNGEQLPANEDRMVRDGDKITIGPVTMTLDFHRPWPDGLHPEWERQGTEVGSTLVASAGTGLLVLQLPRALREGELHLYYQPQINLAARQLVSVEALIRWIHPEHGMVSPAMFIPQAEESGFIRQVTLFAIGAAATQARAWRESGRHLGVSVNISVRDLEDTDFPSKAVQAVTAAGGHPSHLVLEVTESGIISKRDDVLGTMAGLRASGFKFSIDDFGTGESSLGYLARLDVDEVKLDMSFAQNLTDRNEIIVRGAIAMAHGLGLTVVAEGVEDEPTAAKLQDMGCDLAQGYFFGRPAPAADLPF